MSVRPDFIFTYWVLAWYIAYIMKLTPYNPKWGLMIGILLNIGVSFAVILRAGIKKTSVISYSIINFLMKGIPLYSIIHTNTTIKDIYAIAVLFAIYTLWVNVNGTTVIKENVDIFQAIMKGKRETPVMRLIDKIH